MKFYELNLAATNDFSNLDDNEALCSFISNEVIWVKPEGANKQISLSYDKEHQILKIVHHNFSIQLRDFTSYTYLPYHFFVPFQVAIASLITKNYSINIVSKNGTFHPVIMGHNDDNGRIMNAYIVYNQEPSKDVLFSRLNNFIYPVDNQENDTTTVLYPVTKENLNYIKSSFSFLYSWKKAINSQHGRLLVPSRHVAGKLFINGRAFNDLASFEKPILFYSYELELDAEVRLWAINPSLFPIPKMIKRVISGLAKDDKTWVCQSLVNNDYALEWFIPEIEELITKHLLIACRNQYLVCEPSLNVKNYLELAQQNNKTIIYLSPATYRFFADNPSCNLLDWALDFLKKQSSKKITKDDKLTSEEENNLVILNKFCDYFPTKEDLTIKQFEDDKKSGRWANYKSPDEIFDLHQHTKLQVLVIENCPNHLGFFDDELHAIMIDQSNLKTLAQAFTACYQILEARSYMDQYALTWVATMGKRIEELRSKLNNKQDLNKGTAPKKKLN